jgi:hypothetical protein
LGMKYKCKGRNLDKKEDKGKSRDCGMSFNEKGIERDKGRRRGQGGHVRVRAEVKG